MKKYKNKFKSFIMLYGWKFALLKVFKAVIYRITSFRWEKNYLMTRVLDEEIELHIGDDMLIREIVIDDYNKCWKDDYVDNNRLNSYIGRLNRNDTIALGVFIDGRLAYSTWILFNGIEVNGTFHKKNGYGMLWDSYCLPKYRGRGLHNIMNAHSLNILRENKMNVGCVIILSHNTPAFKTQIRCGMEINKVFYTYCFLRKNYSTLKI